MMLMMLFSISKVVHALIILEKHRYRIPDGGWCNRYVNNSRRTPSCDGSSGSSGSSQTEMQDFDDQKQIM
jgi:hypothetical protein